MKKQHVLLGVFLLGLLFLSGCTATSNPSTGMPGPDGETAGFLMGLWHGFIAPVTFVVSLFVDDIEIYEVFNNGNWYNFGFVLGIGGFFGGGGAGTQRGRRNRG